MKDRTLALAALYQVATLVQAIARHGQADETAMRTIMYSLFQLDAPNVLGVYDQLYGLRLGLEQIIEQFEGKQARDIERVRYVVSLLHLERKLSRLPDNLQAIRQRLIELQSEADEHELTDIVLIRELAELYGKQVSTVSPRIMISGEPVYIQNPDNAARIRALLLGGIRNAMLWRQLGGTRKQLIFGRRKWVESARELLAQALPVTQHQN